ncbi:hypothetical protein [Kitasatospora sp. NPDC047058]|uniref:hypothetical protein n=1 Tax=Kitasatospora sp. NPDC047058 TaxID=3155620 RepID=UPI0033D5BF7E
MRSNSMKLTVAALAAATALSLAACGPDNSDATAGGGAAGATTPPAAATGGAGGAAGAGGTATSPAAAGGAAGAAGGGAAPSAGATAGAAAGGAAAGGAAAGGASGGGAAGEGAPQAATAVKIGQKVTVDFADKQAKIATKLEITVTGIEVGSIQDFTAAKIDPTGLSGKTPMYLSYTMKNIGDASLSFTAPDSKFVYWDSTGQKGYGYPNSATPLAKCPPTKFQGFSKGVEVKGCTIIASKGNTPGVIGYTDVTDLLKLQASWSK